jgi:hypothetical protein
LAGSQSLRDEFDKLRKENDTLRQRLDKLDKPAGK